MKKLILALAVMAFISSPLMVTSAQAGQHAKLHHAKKHHHAKHHSKYHRHT